jgi:hypothetical protein
MSEEAYGFCKNKCKQPVYTKEQANVKFLKVENTAVIFGKATLEAMPSGSEFGKETVIDIPYPKGFDKWNTVVISFSAGSGGAFHIDNDKTVGAYGEMDNIIGTTTGLFPRRIVLKLNNMSARFENILEQSILINYKIVLMRIDGAFDEQITEE